MVGVIPKYEYFVTPKTFKKNSLKLRLESYLYRVNDFGTAIEWQDLITNIYVSLCVWGIN